MMMQCQQQTSLLAEGRTNQALESAFGGCSGALATSPITGMATPNGYAEGPSYGSLY